MPADSDAKLTVVERGKAAASRPDHDNPATAPPPRGEPAAPPPRDANDLPIERASRPSEPPPWRYWNGAEIARGGMGRVVEATDTMLGRVVAVKEALSTDPDAMRRFARETRITARLEHPAIVPVYDAGRTPDGSPFYVMRKVSGRPLEQLVTASRTLQERLALLPHLLATAQAVAHAHAQGIIHRDLKPANILVGSLGETVVIDWGLAKEVGEPDETATEVAFDAGDSLRTRVGIVFGTPGFMSPEQLAAEPVDARADVYALGATLYQLLAKKPPHAAASSEAMMDAARLGPPQPIGELEPGVPPELTTIVDKALAYHVADRYPDASALAADLQRFLTGQLVAAHRYSPRERLRRFVRKNRVAVIAVAAATLALAIVAWVAVGRVIAERDLANAARIEARADQHAAEAATAKATERADELLLLQAQTLIDTNPTAAVALAKQLSNKPDRWRQIRAIGAGARAAGAVWGLPASRQTTAVYLSPDGMQAVASGIDGVIRLYDLPNRTTRIIKLPQAVDHHATFLGDSHLAVISPKVLTLYDLRTNTHRDLPIHGTEKMVASSRAAYWNDDGNGIWETTLDGVSTHLFDTPDASWGVVISPDGNWLEYNTPETLTLVDVRTHPVTRHEIPEKNVVSVAWSADSSALMVTTNKEVVNVRLETVPTIAVRVPLSDPYQFACGIDGNIMYFASFHGLFQILPGKEPRELMPGGRNVSTVAIARDHTVVFNDPQGGITLINPQLKRRIPIPGDDVMHITTSFEGRYMVATMPGRLLVWDLTKLMPEHLAVGNLSRFELVDRVHALVIGLIDSTKWVDVDTGNVEVGPVIGPIDTWMVDHGGARILSIGNGHARLGKRGSPTAVEVADDVQFGAFELDGGLLFGTTHSALVSYDPKTNRRVTLFSHPGGIDSLCENQGWIGAIFSDGLAWRTDPKGNQHTFTITGYDPRSSPIPMMIEGGTMMIAAGKQLLGWAPDGTVSVLATIPAAIHYLVPLDDKLFVVVTVDNAAYTVGMATPDKYFSLIPAAAHLQLAVAPLDHDLAIAVEGRIDIIDAETGAHWQLQPTGGAATDVAMSPDGRTIAVTADPETLAIWHLDMPMTAAELPDWLETITNATAEHGTTTVDWR